MTWQDNLLPASFRGVPFFYDDTRREGGRRMVNNEFPGRDDNYLEDLGKKAKQHRIVAWVIGDDYDDQRDALEDALDEEGTGTFVHPYKGSLTVGCPSYSLSEVVARGGMASFEITFIEGGDQPSPISSTNTATAASDAADDQQDTLASDFGSLYSLQGLPGFISDALSGNITGLVGDLTSLAGLPDLGVGSLLDELAAITDAIDDPVALGTAVTGFFSAYGGQVADILPVDNPTTSSRGQPPVTDPSYGLAAFANWGTDLPPVLGTTPQRLQQAANQAALLALVQGSAVAALAQLYANTNFVSATDAETARTQITDLIDHQATTAADVGDDLAFGGWMALYSTASADLTTRAQQLPQILTYKLGASLPALVLAERIYQDASLAPDLISRNAAPHPLFMPMSIEALAA